MVAKSRRPLLTGWGVLMLLGIALGALLLTIQPLGAQEEAPTLSNAVTAHDYVENGSGPITTFRARDPENNPVFWTLGGADAADFSIVGGTLRFKSPPDYEVPTDRTNDEDGSGTTDPATEGQGNNVYKVTVRFGAGGEDGDPGDDAYNGDDLGEIELTVNVTNLNEPGNVVISPMQPQVGTMLTAILTDEDNVAPRAGEWQWARSDSMNGPWEDIPSLSTSMTFRPTIDDLGKYLRLTVVYVDRAGADPRTVQEVSAYAVREDTVTSNAAPKFPNQATLVGGNDIEREDTDRFISETAAAGTRVGAPVTAFDDATDIEVITYSLRDAAATPRVTGSDDTADDDGNEDTPVENDGHATSFDIDEVTGQLTVSASATLNADAGGTNPYEVVVRAVDGDGDTEDINVTIAVLQAGEPPRIDRVYVAGDRLPDGFTAGNRVPTEMSHFELDRTNDPATEIDTNLDTDTVLTGEAAIYTASDPDAGDTITWSLAGPDGGKFAFGVDADGDPITTVTTASATLAFGSGPDFEERGDANEDNVYQFTIVVTDNTGLKDALGVTVKVLNSTDDNEAGTVSFSNRVPEVATAITATHNDTDGGVRELKWQWYRSEADTIYPAACPDSAHTPRYFLEETPATIATAWTAIAGATSRSYTPVAEDENTCLRATVTYRDAVDRTHTPANDNTTPVDETLEATWAATERPVKPIDERNKAPVFRAGITYDAAPVSVYRAEIIENTMPADERIISEALAAVDVTTGIDDEDADTDDTIEDDGDNDDVLTYTLGGRDKDSFTITGTIDHNSVVTTELSSPTVADGRLTISAGLDFEGQREYRVTITATDPSGDKDSVNVIVNVTNVNDMPGWETNPAMVVYVENDTVAVGTYLAVDPEGSGITYSLAEVDDVDGVDVDADNDLFEISSIGGILRFKSSPNFEDAQDDGTNNMYQVAVRADVADDSGHFITETVTVRVTNVNEAPMFSDTIDDLDISENPDDPEKEPPSAAKELYLLNRGVGIPAADLPAAPNLDVGIPIVAVDDDNNGSLITGLDRISDSRQLIHGLTYELSGAGRRALPHSPGHRSDSDPGEAGLRGPERIRRHDHGNRPVGPLRHHRSDHQCHRRGRGGPCPIS